MSAKPSSSRFYKRQSGRLERELREKKGFYLGDGEVTKREEEENPDTTCLIKSKFFELYYVVPFLLTVRGLGEQNLSFLFLGSFIGHQTYWSRRGILF